MAPRGAPMPPPGPGLRGEAEFLLLCMECSDGKVNWEEVACKSSGRFKSGQTAKQYYSCMKERWLLRCPLTAAPHKTTKTTFSEPEHGNKHGMPPKHPKSSQKSASLKGLPAVDSEGEKALVFTLPAKVIVAKEKNDGMAGPFDLAMTSEEEAFNKAMEESHGYFAKDPIFDPNYTEDGAEFNTSEGEAK